MFENTTEIRYRNRIHWFKSDKMLFPKTRHWMNWFFHNCIVHPLIGLVPCKQTFELHDLSSNWLNKR